MSTKIERYIPSRFNRPILYGILNHDQIRNNKYDKELYINAVEKFEEECEQKQIKLFQQIGIISSVKSDRFSLPSTNEIICEIEGASYVNYPFTLSNLNRMIVKELLEKNIFKIRFYLFVDVITEDDTMSKSYHGKVVYKFRYMVHS
jgi:hypothetical protein